MVLRPPPGQLSPLETLCGKLFAEALDLLGHLDAGWVKEFAVPLPLGRGTTRAAILTPNSSMCHWEKNPTSRHLPP